MYNATPDKNPKISCFLCSKSVKRLHLLANTKCSKAGLVKLAGKMLNISFKEELIQKTNVCDFCFEYIIEHESKCKLAILNLSSIEENVKRPKRTVAETITRSVEKLKKLKFTESSGVSVRRKLEYNEHSYQRKEEQEFINDQGEDVFNNTNNEVLSLIEKQLQSAINFKSVLSGKNASQLCENLFYLSILELRQKCPVLFYILNTAFSKIANKDSRMATIATVYGMIAHSRNNKISAIQRLFSTIVIANNADNRLLTELNKVHITLTEHSKRTLIDTYGKESEERILKTIAEGKDGKINGDNLDIRINTNEMRLDSRNKDLHFFASSFTMDRINLQAISQTTPRIIEELNTENFLPTNDEYKIFKNSLKTLLAREISKMKGFSWMASVIETHIPHEHQEDMNTKSNIHILPVSLNNEIKYQDCIKILDEYECNLNRWYTKVGRGGDLETLRVPVGGDQLTRVRLQGAKSLRDGAHTAVERFDHLQPMVIEMFHTLQDYLEKLCKKFLDFDLCKDIGTLPNLKLLIQRDNVNGNVKSRFKAHEDFIITCGVAYLYSYIMWKFDMATMEDAPKHKDIPENINRWTNQNKRRVFDSVMDEVVADLFIPFKLKNEEMTVSVSVHGQSADVTVRSAEVLTIPITINNQAYHISADKKKIENGLHVSINNIAIFLKANTGNCLKQYVKNFLQWFFVIIQMKDTVKEGDILRTNIILKCMIPFFYSHSVLSKYLVECIDFILKTEHTLSPYMALKVRAGSFVNITGKPGKNKAADLQKENEVKYLKSLIRSLGANKTENAIVNITRAGPVIKEIQSNYENMTGLKQIKSTHKMKSREADIQLIITRLKQLDIWRKGDTMFLNKELPNTLFKFDHDMFENTVMSKVELLMYDIPVPEEQELDNE